MADASLRAHAWPLLRFVLTWALALLLLGIGVPRAVNVSWHGVVPVLAALHASELLGLALLWVLGLWVHTFVLTAAAPSLTHRRALTLNVTGSAVSNIVPLGGAAGVALNHRMMRAWGVSGRSFAGFILLTNLWDVLAKLALPGVALVVLDNAGEAATGRVQFAALVGLAAFVVVLALLLLVLLSPRLTVVLGGAVELGVTRVRELDEAARHLGVARVVRLGYADSGMAHSPTTGEGRFVDADPEQAARRLADILDVEAADVLTGYDARGGYGHPDHVQVHRVARLAQGIATQRPRLLEATRDRTLLVRGIRLTRPVARAFPGITLPGTAIYSARDEITHRVDVRPYLPNKRAALAAHASQTTGGVRTIGVLLRLPPWITRRLLGVECFVEVP